MKVFISWSGHLSQKVAEALHLWLPVMIQSIEPYVSSEDTFKGVRWHDVVARELEDSNYGILCITSDNIYQPWLNFEAGALSKSVEKSHVSPFLIDVKLADITGPLLQFQATSLTYNDVLRLLKSINATLVSPIDQLRIERAFKNSWPELRQSIDQAIKESSQPRQQVKAGRSAEEMLGELIELVRAQQNILSDLISSPAESGSLSNKLTVLREVDFAEVGYLLKRLKDAADIAVIPGRPETASMVQLRALVDLLAKCLSPALDKR